MNLSRWQVEKGAGLTGIDTHLVMEHIIATDKPNRVRSITSVPSSILLFSNSLNIQANTSMKLLMEEQRENLRHPNIHSLSMLAKQHRRLKHQATTHNTNIAELVDCRIEPTQSMLSHLRTWEACVRRCQTCKLSLGNLLVVDLKVT